MKICCIANPNSVHTHRWVKYFYERGHDVYLIGEHKPVIDPPSGVTIYDLSDITNTRKYRYLRWGLEARRIVRQLQPDILHALGAVGAGWLGYMTGFHPFLITAMGSDINLLQKRSSLFQRFTKSTLRNADYILCVSNDLFDKVLAFGGNPDKREVVYRGVDLDTFHPGANKGKIRRKLSIEPNPTILSIRSMNWLYNPLDIAKAVPLVLQQIPQTRFIVFTYNQDKDVFSQFKKIIKQNNSTYAVNYVGGMNDDSRLANYYRASDLAISVPSSDGTPNSVLECMACGTPVVLSDLPSLHDWAKDEKDSLFVPVGDAPAIGKAIIRLLSDKIMLDKLGHNASKAMKNRADHKIWMKRIEQIYYQLAGNVSP